MPRKFLVALLLLLLAAFCGPTAVAVPVTLNFTNDIASMELMDLNKVDTVNAPSSLLHRDEDLPRLKIDANAADSLKYDVEILESSEVHKETEPYEEQYRSPGSLHAIDTNAVVNENIEVHGGDDGAGHVHGLTLTIILASAAILAIALYVLLVKWKMYLGHRYGTRQLLVSNGDDDDHAYSPQGLPSNPNQVYNKTTFDNRQQHQQLQQKLQL